MTLAQILRNANSFLDLEDDIPTGDELMTRINYANQAVNDAAVGAQFAEFHSIYQVNPSAMASVSLPSNFRELETSPRQLRGDGAYDQFDAISPNERFNKNSDDKYCYVLGNSQSGYTAVFNGLTANATLSIDFQRFPSGMATLSDICELPDPQYVVTKIEAYVLMGRSDDRFPQVEADAQRRLQNMVGRESKQVINETRKRVSAAYNSGYQ